MIPIKNQEKQDEASRTNSSEDANHRSRIAGFRSEDNLIARLFLPSSSEPVARLDGRFIIWVLGPRDYTVSRAEARLRAAATDRLRQEYFPPTFRKKNILLEHFTERRWDYPDGSGAWRRFKRILVGRRNVVTCCYLDIETKATSSCSWFTLGGVYFDYINGKDQLKNL